MPAVQNAIDKAGFAKNEVDEVVFLDHASYRGWCKTLDYIQYTMKRGQVMSHTVFKFDLWSNYAEIAVANQSLGMSYLVYRMLQRLRDMACEKGQNQKFNVGINDLNKLATTSSIADNYPIKITLFRSIANSYANNDLANAESVTKWMNWSGNFECAARILEFEVVFKANEAEK